MSALTSADAVQEFRLTKYDPARRDAQGRYNVDEWTYFAQVGKCFAGVELTFADYERVEAAHLDAVQALLRGAGIDALVVRDAEPSIQGEPPAVAAGTRLSGDALREAFRDVLRERWWCRFEADDATAFVHFGWDYYIYLGLPRLDDDARRRVEDAGLFLEPFISPYHRRPGDEDVDDG